MDALRIIKLIWTVPQWGKNQKRMKTGKRNDSALSEKVIRQEKRTGENDVLDIWFKGTQCTISLKQQRSSLGI